MLTVTLSTGQPGISEPQSVLSSYRPGACYDELIGPDGQPRPIARDLVDDLRRCGRAGLGDRQAAADEEIRRIGVTFHIRGDDTGLDRPWPFDVVPRLIHADEWSRIRDGLVQRLRALNLFIDDVYHDQRSIQAGIVPGDVVVSSPNFRPECVGADNPPGRLWAHICGSDLVRGEDGTLYVLEDNLRVPSGVSYLLENRMVAKRVFPELFRSYSVEPVDPYIGKLNKMFSTLMGQADDPTVAILTPGVHNAAYCEHAFLAQQLGAELVEGSDLVVVDDAVHMRTIDGLERVDIVYRRVDDAYLDPEVFRSESLIGVPGIMRAWRAGNVAIVSAPGAGVADDKAIYAYAPEIIRYFLDEEPILANVPTWRCSDPDDCRYVLGHLDALVVKPATESGGYRGGHRSNGRRRGPCQGGPADRAAPVELGGPTRALAIDDAHTGRRRPRTAPRRSSAFHRPRSERCLCGARGPHSRRPVVGILGRELLTRGQQQGHLGGELDRRHRSFRQLRGRARLRRRRCGLLSSPVEWAADRRAAVSVLIPEKPAPLLARMAEVLYWTGRYLERAEDTARVASVHGETHIDLPVGEDVGWYPLLEIAGSAELFIEQFPHFDTTEHRPSRSIPSAEERITRFVLFDRSNPSSIISSVFSARYNLRQARPVVPREVWELCNELWASLKEGGEGARTRDERVRWLRAVIDECHRINGVLLGTMRRDEALAFLRLGQQVERASMTCRVLAVRAESAAAMSGSDPYRDAHHMAILRSLASYQPFRRATPTGRDAAMLVEFLLQDQHLPRSVNACLAELRELVKALPRNEAVLASCTDTSVMVAAAPITEADPGGLRSFLVDLQEAIGHIHHQIAESYFGAVRAVGTASPGREIDGRPRRQPSSAETSTHDPGILGTIRGMDPGTLLDMQAGMTCRVTHLTTYEYDAPVEHAYNEAHLRPRNENGQQCLTHFLQVDPPPAACSETVDTFGNRVTIFSVLGGFERLSVEATSEVVTVSPRPAPAGPPWESVRVMLDVDRQPAGRTPAAIVRPPDSSPPIPSFWTTPSIRFDRPGHSSRRPRISPRGSNATSSTS